ESALAWDQAVDSAGVATDDLLPHARGQVTELLCEHPGRVRPDVLGMRDIRAPHHVVLAQLVDHLDADAIGLVRGHALPPPVVARLHAEPEVPELVLPLEVHVIEDVGDPADATLADDHAHARMALEHAAVDHRHQDGGHVDLEAADVHGEPGAGHAEVHRRVDLLAPRAAPERLADGVAHA